MPRFTTSRITWPPQMKFHHVTVVSGEVSGRFGTSDGRLILLIQSSGNSDFIKTLIAAYRYFYSVSPIEIYCQVWNTEPYLTIQHSESSGSPPLPATAMPLVWIPVWPGLPEWLVSETQNNQCPRSISAIVPFFPSFPSYVLHHCYLFKSEEC